MLTLVVVALTAGLPAQAEPLPVAIVRQMQRQSTTPLWPGFHPTATPLAIFWRGRTWLFGHPSPPAGFVQDPGAAVFVFKGLHPEVRANTSIVLGGVQTAVVMVDDKAVDPVELAALAIHETFHVFELAKHPKWTADEGQLFIYPYERADILHLRRLETEALRRAAAAGDEKARAEWARAFLGLRRNRAAAMPPEAIAYERGIELKEGLARFVQDRARGTTGAPLPADEFGAEDVRERGYAIGATIGHVLSRMRADWPEALEQPAAAADLLALESAVARHAGPGVAAVFTATETAAALQAARQDTSAIEASRAGQRIDFVAQPGWTLVVRASEEPLWPQGFDPLNVRPLGGGVLLHARFLKLGNAAGSLEMLNGRGLTESAGEHPLFNGVRTFTIAGLAAAPDVQERDGGVTFVGGAVKGAFSKGSVQREGQTVTVIAGSKGGSPLLIGQNVVVRNQKSRE
jgi:hypothetical protein